MAGFLTTTAFPAAATSPAALMTFTFNLRPIRYVIIGGDPWFAAKDVCDAVALSNTSDSLEKLDEDEKMIARVQTAGGSQDLSVVSEGGLYTLILRCRGATTPGSVAHRFRKMVTAEVLPEIRRTGTYGAPKPPTDPAALLMEQMKNPSFAMELIGHYASENLALRRERDAIEGQLTATDQELIDTSRALTVTTNRLAIAQETIEEQAPAAEALDRLTNAHGGSNVTSTAKRLGVKPGALFDYMRNPKATVRWLIKKSKDAEDLAFQDRLNAVELVSPVESVWVTPKDRDPYEKLVTRVYVTPKGLTRLAKLIVDGKDPLLPRPMDLLHVMRLARGDRSSRARSADGDPDLFD